MSSKRKIKRFAPSVIGVLLVAIVAGFFLFRYSMQAAPGELLYPLKRQTEEVLKQLTITTADKKIEYEVKLADKRLLELKKVRDDVARATVAVDNFNKHFDNIEAYYEELIKQGDNEKSFANFEKINLSIYSFQRTVEASKKTYNNVEYKNAVGAATSRLNKSVDNLFEISINNFGEYPKFLKYAIDTYEGYQYKRIFEEIKYAKDDYEAVKKLATTEQKTTTEKQIKDFETKYDELMKKRTELTAKQIFDILKELKKMEFDISVSLVEISKNAAQVSPAPTPAE